MTELTIARALHVLAVVHWIGGVFMVTAVILPSVARLAEPERRIALFESIEGAFSWQAKISVTLAGATGFYMTARLDAWSRFLDPAYWWMHAMVAVWALFTFVLFVAEPLFLHQWFRRAAARDPAATFALIQRFHWALLTASLVTIGAAVLGAHGALG
ncbi:MAG: hypothetical protein A3E78_07700 [Alphaproteobacteria bacterium RIFCSPHIGHO2_12_FULL_63_12]|nr:MAG: hypothetical protein A3E78_07700 [Alphaproteobacteria bacterium RIFCSPHIGHO2_12_FULL_63_12]